MEFKIFMKTVEQEIAKFKSESEIKEWLANYARTIPEKERESFLTHFQKRKERTHNELLKTVTDWCQKIDNEEITLSYSEYESYGEGYWDRDWVTEYEDPAGIGKQLERFYDLAEQCVYDRDYKTASLIYWNLGTLQVAAESDEDWGDSVELGIEEMVSEELISVDSKRIAALTLYSAYQSSKPDVRAQKIYGYFSWGMFKEIRIEDMLSAGTEALEQVDEFMESWITYLREQTDRYTARLLEEAVIYQKGTEGLLEEAKRCANQHPRLFIEVLEKFYSDEKWDRLRTEGIEALKLMDRKMKIRGKAARLAAAGARKINDRENEKYACIEAFYSEYSSENFLRMITCSGIKESETAAALAWVERARKSCKVTANWEWNRVTDLDSYVSVGNEYLTIQFFMQQFDTILGACQKQKEYLGWSGKYIYIGVPLLLLLLHKGETWGSAMISVINEAGNDVRYHSLYGEPSFQEMISLWKKQVKLDKEIEEEILKYLQKMIDGRVAAIVSGGHRGSYYQAAKLGAALGEVEESMGKSQGKAYRIHLYLNQFPRHSAFKREMKEFMAD